MRPMAGFCIVLALGACRDATESPAGYRAKTTTTSVSWETLPDCPDYSCLPPGTGVNRAP